MTVNEVLKQIVPELEKIKIPITELQSIGAPISAAIANLKNCIEAMDKAEREAKEKSETEVNENDA